MVCMERLDALKMLIELCKERKQLFQNTLFFECKEEELLEISKKIYRLAKKLSIYAVNENSLEGISIAFNDLNTMQQFTGEEPLTKSYRENLSKYKYEASLFHGELTVYCYVDEGHKKSPND